MTAFSLTSAAPADHLDAAAQAIVLLINSRPHTPNVGEIRGALERCLARAGKCDLGDGTSIAPHAETWRRFHAAAHIGRALAEIPEHCADRHSDAFQRAAYNSERNLRKKLWELPVTSQADNDLLTEVWVDSLWPGWALFTEHACVLLQEASYWEGENGSRVVAHLLRAIGELRTAENVEDDLEREL